MEENIEKNKLSLSLFFFFFPGFLASLLKLNFLLRLRVFVHWWLSRHIFFIILSTLLFMESCAKTDKEAFEEVSLTHTVAAYENFIKGYPDSPFIKEVEGKIKVIRQKAWKEKYYTGKKLFYSFQALNEDVMNGCEITAVNFEQDLATLKCGDTGWPDYDRSGEWTFLQLDSKW